jgi:hypothetical protein
MPRTGGSIVINRPLEEVFDYVSNVDNFPEWAGGAIEVHKDEPGPLREGYRFTVVASLLGRRFENRYELASYDPPRHYKHRGTGGPIPNQEWTYIFEELAEQVLSGEVERGVGAVAAQLLNGARACVATRLKAIEQEDILERIEELESILERQNEYRRRAAW